MSYDRGMRCVCLLMVGCYTGTEPPATTPQPDSWHDASGPNAYNFDDRVGYAYRACKASAPPQITISLQAHPAGKAPVAIAIEVEHGPTDHVPREITVKDPQCTGCSGHVWLDELVPGKHMNVRIDLQFLDGHVARQKLVVPWQGGAWDVRPCPTGPDAYPR